MEKIKKYKITGAVLGLNGVVLSVVGAALLINRAMADTSSSGLDSFAISLMVFGGIVVVGSVLFLVYIFYYS